MPGLRFDEQAPIAPSAPNRMDIALMVGFVPMRSGAILPASILQWLKERGWTAPRYASRLNTLLDIPILLESWKQFDQLFAWEQRTSSDRDGSTYLGAAVRSFFSQGGRRCYVVRAGDPAPLEALRPTRMQSVSLLIPGYPFHFDPSPADRESWHGVGHLFGLPDVSFICLPDLTETVSLDRTRVPLASQPPGPAEVFAECSVELPAPPPDLTVRDIRAPRCDDAGYADWAAAVNLVTDTLARRNRETEFVAAVPLPQKSINFTGLRSTAFLQLTYPWVRTSGSISLADNLEPPDGALTGILARNALISGTYQTAANFGVGDIAGLSPELSREEQNRLEKNICLVGPTPLGLRLLTDVTMSSTETFRPGSVSRLLATVVRTARRIGEDVTFEPSGEQAWATVRQRLNTFLLGLYHAGALRGSSPDEAFSVRCDRTTMTQNDLDVGRMIAIVQLDPAAPIDTITIVLVMNEDRQVLEPVGEAA